MKKLFACLLSLQFIISPIIPAQAAGDEYRNVSASNKSGDLVFHANQILALGIGITGASVLAGCKSGPSVYSLYPFMAAGLGYIGSEITGGDDHSEYLNQSAEKIKMVEAKVKEFGVQKASLDEALESERNNLKYIKKKLAWMAAISALFYGAMGTAIYEKITHEALKRTAQVTSTTAKSTCVSTGTTCSAGCAALIVGAPACVVGCQLIQKSCIATAEVAYQATLKSLVVANTTMCAPGTSLIKSKLLSTVVVGAYSKYALKAGGEGQISNIGGIALSLLPVLNLLNIQIDIYDKVRNNLLGNEKKRIITFGAFAAVASAVTIGLNGKKKAVEENIKKLEKVIANFKEETENNKDELAEGEFSNPNGDPTKTKAALGNIKMLATNPSRPPKCFSAAVDNFSENSCSNSLKLTKPTFNFGSGLPMLAAVNNSASNLAKAVAEGRSADADLEVNNLGSMAARVKETTEQLKTKLNTDLKAQGEPAIDFDKDINAQVAQIQSDVDKAAADQGVNLAKSEAGPTSEDVSAPIVASVEAPSVPLAPEIDLGSLEPSISEETFTEPTASTSLEQNLDHYESTIEDIAKKSDVSIFKQVSNRYLLNYTKIFKEKKRID